MVAAVPGPVSITARMGHDASLPRFSFGDLSSTSHRMTDKTVEKPHRPAATTRLPLPTSHHNRLEARRQPTATPPSCGCGDLVKDAPNLCGDRLPASREVAAWIDLPRCRSHLLGYCSRKGTVQRRT